MSKPSKKRGTGVEKEAARCAPLTVGFLLLPNFTLTAFAAFLDAFRLAADEGDKSRQISYRWAVMSIGECGVKSSSGVVVQPTEQLCNPRDLDYLTVVGGLLRASDYRNPKLAEYLRKVAEAGLPVIGLGTGSFALAHAGLLSGRRCCVSWYHLQDFRDAFPHQPVVSDQLFVIDRDRITCAGGTGVVDLAAFLIEKKFGRNRAMKVLRLMHTDHFRAPSAPQWRSPFDVGLADDRVRRAVTLMEEKLDLPPEVESIASTVGLSARQLQRAFRRATGASVMAFSRALRLEHARELLLHTRQANDEIACGCGFTDASHFARWFRQRYGVSPSELRASAKESMSRTYRKASRAY